MENPDSRSFNFSVEADTRFGFWKHVSITVSWERPSRKCVCVCVCVSGVLAYRVCVRIGGVFVCVRGGVQKRGMICNDCRTCMKIYTY